MSRGSVLKESDLIYSGKTDNLEPIIIKFPITEDDLLLTLEGIHPIETRTTMEELRQKYHSFPAAVVGKCLLLGLAGILLFYLFVLLITLTLFNLVLILIFFILYLNYAKWMYKSLKEMRESINMRQIKVYLDHENQRFYSSRLLRFQLY